LKIIEEILLFIFLFESGKTTKRVGKNVLLAHVFKVRLRLLIFTGRGEQAYLPSSPLQVGLHVGYKMKNLFFPVV
jgi:hypothetical protein